MAVERADLSPGAILERMAPAMAPLAAGEQSSPQPGEGKPPRRRPDAQPASVEPAEAEAAEPAEEAEDSGGPPLRIDSLA